MLRILTTVVLLCSCTVPALAADDLAGGFQVPPASTRPWCYWYWISDNISKAGITRDLEAMKQVGIGEAFIGNIYLDDVKLGGVKALTEEWWGMVEHAIREGGRLGVDIGMFNCPGWSQSGGPWVQPGQAMRYLAMTEQRVQGPRRFAQKLPAPKEPFQDVALLALPAPQSDADTAAARQPRVTCSPQAESAGRLMDGMLDAEWMFPKGAGQANRPFIVDIELAQPLTARSLVLHPAATAFAASCELQVAGEGGQFRSVRTFSVDRSNTAVNVGFLPHGPVAITFPAQTATKFRLVFTRVGGAAGLTEIELTGAARVERFVEKQLAKMHPTPLPTWDTYTWPTPTEPEGEGLAVRPGGVECLSDRLATDGTLRWDVPAGEWILLRIGMTPTGTRNAPASPQGQGLEVDKMNRVAALAHFDAFLGKLLARMPAADRKAFKRVVADSYEMGSQNWTDGFAEQFRARYGYDPLPWLGVLSGRVMGSADQSDRFLWDLRRLVADRVAYDYVGGLRDACHRHGLLLWLENYGHWGFPAEFLQYGGQADQVSGEFWATGDLGSIELRAAASCAHTYGRPVVSAEAFTSVQKFEGTPWSLKKRGDWALTEGINHWVLHVNIHQPDERRPGVNAWFSTEFNRHNTWFEPGKAWVDYYRRCHFLLQHGRHVADVAYFIGEDAPKMTGVRKPDLPAGYDFDYINAEVIQQRLKVVDGRFVLPDGKSYRLLVLPQQETMRPEVLRAIRDLVAAGGTVLGTAPSRSPSMQNYPACDEEVRRLVAELWGEGREGKLAAPQPVWQRRVGQGRVVVAKELKPVLDTLQASPDFAGADPKQILWTHRSAPDAEIYFLSNQSEQPTTIVPQFRVRGMQPELWDAASGRIVNAAAYAVAEGGIRVPVELEPRGSVFVVFRASATPGPSVTSAAKDGQPILTTEAKPYSAEGAGTGDDSARTFTMAGWLKPAADIGLPKEANTGVFLSAARNDAVTAAHGDAKYPEGGHAGAGISAGRNGIVVYEHSSNYFAPLLVHAAPLDGWTHVAVVYQDGLPSLYLNGRLAHRGLKSRYIVHSSLGGGQGSAGFKGERGELQDFSRALAAAEIAALAKTQPPAASESPLPAIQLARDDRGRVTAEVSAVGRYQLKLSDGRTESFEVKDLPGPVELGGPWEVRFPARMDVPASITLKRLASLSEHANEAVKHFSGTATYVRTFDLPAGRRGDNGRTLLDLGRVEAMAEVVVNGQNLGVAWKPPFVVDITSAAKTGSNTLEVRVTGTWRNRLIGAAKFPSGFPATDGKANAKPQFQPYLTADIKVPAQEPLAPFGLLGPVRIRMTERIVLGPTASSPAAAPVRPPRHP